MTKPFILAFVCAACVVDVGGAQAPPQPPGDQDPAQICADPRYGDGVCTMDLACDVPDIDCFQTFKDDTVAALWYAEREAAKAADEGRPVRALLPPSDPRFVELRALYDQAWLAFIKTRPVGRLVEHRPALVVIDDAGVNAFVMANSSTYKQALCVMVNVGVTTAPFDDDGRLGLLLHELQHIVGLHGIPGVRDAVKRHYVAAGGEPIGRLQPDDPIVRAAMTGWMTMADDVGPYTHTELGGFPYDGILWGMLDKIAEDGRRIDPTNCTTAANLVAALRDDLVGARDPLDERLVMDLSTVPRRVTDALALLRDRCMLGVSLTFVDTLAALLGDSPAQVAAEMSTEDLQRVSGKHVVDAIATLASHRRSTMRTLERSLPQAQPWSSARYFSNEEDADDVAVIVMRAAGRDANAYAAALESAVAKRGADAASRCAAMLDAGAVPGYGVDLRDRHHASCWRTYHALQMAKLDLGKSRRFASEPHAPIVVGLPQPRTSELIIHD